MSTHAIFTFEDDYNTVHVFKHYDGYPKSAISFIFGAKPFAWPLPRFEADEFAGAFIRANKDSPGDIRVIPSNKDPEEFSLDTEWSYKISCVNSTLHVRVAGPNERFYGSLEQAFNHYVSSYPTKDNDTNDLKFWVTYDKDGNFLSADPFDEKMPDNGVPALAFERGRLFIRCNFNKQTASWTPPVGPGPIWRGKLGTYQEMWQELAQWLREQDEQ